MNGQSNSLLKQYLPLILVFVGIILITLIKTSLAPTWNWHNFFTDFMGFFFVTFGLFKVIRWQSFAQSYAQYDLIAKKSTMYAYAYPIIEISLGLAYIMKFNLPIINIITLVLMIESSLGVFNTLRTQGTFMCACLGTLFSIPLTWVTLAEDLLMATMALLMLLNII